MKHFTVIAFLIAYLVLPVITVAEHPPANKPVHEKPVIRSSKTTAGLYFGYIYLIDTDQMSVILTPIDRSLPRKRFYLDKKTIYKLDKKRIKFEDLELGHKAAVRFIQRRGVALAEALFMVTEEFVREDYLPKKKVVVKSEGGEEKKEGKKEGEKAESAKPEAKKGGH